MEKKGLHALIAERPEELAKMLLREGATSEPLPLPEGFGEKASGEGKGDKEEASGEEKGDKKEARGEAKGAKRGRW